MLIGRSLTQLSDYILQREKTLVNLISFFLLCNSRIRLFAALGTCQIDEADLGRGAGVCVMVESIDDNGENEVGSGRVLVHSRACRLTLSNTEIVDFLCILKG